MTVLCQPHRRDAPSSEALHKCGSHGCFFELQKFGRPTHTAAASSMSAWPTAGALVTMLPSLQVAAAAASS